jgi:hypothetical protein
MVRRCFLKSSILLFRAGYVEGNQIKLEHLTKLDYGEVIFGYQLLHPDISGTRRKGRWQTLLKLLSAKESQRLAVYDIQRVSQVDEGTYSCTARNEAGLIIVEPISGRRDIDNDNEVDVNTGGGNIRVDDVFRAPVGGTAYLRCFVTGTPTCAEMKLICRAFLLLTCCA